MEQNVQRPRDTHQYIDNFMNLIDACLADCEIVYVVEDDILDKGTVEDSK